MASRTAEPAPRGLRARLVMLGTGAGPTIRKSRAGPASLLVVDGRVYLIDAGEGVLRQMAVAGFKAMDVDRVFLTHLHFDHTADLASFMAFDWAGLRERPVDIYGPPGTSALTRAGLDYFAISEAIFSQELVVKQPMSALFRAHDLDVTKPTVIYQDDKVRVLAVENSHYSTLRMPPQAYGAVRSYAYRFETPDRVVVFTGDTGPSEGLEQLAKGADILVSEVIDVDKTVDLVRHQWSAPDSALAPLIDHMTKEHFRPEDIGRLAARAGVKMVVLTHFAPGTDDETDPSPYTNGVRRYFSGPVVAARDLDQF
ncbi:MAG: MBL fold metallo-hydrolase [Caulobacteraceae bacterium]|nr:MBL fold metallo-hydrolase [Caulobacteraceae bacterium]